MDSFSQAPSLMKSYPEQLHLFFNALTYFTRFTSPSWVHYTKETQAKSTKYLPWVGLLIGFYAALIYWLSSFIFTDSIAVILSMLSSIWMTGALHEDGLADCCDGFGGGWDKEQILRIMKDSRVGSYGVIGLVVVLLLKFNALLEVEHTIAIIVLGHCLSRLFPLIIIYREKYVSDEETSKSKQMLSPLSKIDLLIATLPAAACFIFLPLSYLSVLAPTIIATACMIHFFKHWIGGYNGDCLGCCQQVNELLIYLWLCIPIFLI